MKHIPISEYNYPLPDERIAKYPLQERDASKLLVYKNEQISESQFSSLADFLPANSLLVMNNTKVIRARLFFQKPSGAQIEVFCLEPHAPADYYQSFQSKGICEWKCMVGNLKKWKEGKIVLTLNHNNEKIEIWAEKLHQENNAMMLKFSWQPENLNFGELLEIAGSIPIPPYLNRESESLDEKRYQTVYALPEGSVAAPTAGLHFSPNVFEKIEKKNITTEQLTLHVGAGTFKPVKDENALDHAMHTEQFFITKSNLQNLLKFNGNITCVGTTSLRALESMYWMGVKLLQSVDRTFHIKQFDPYSIQAEISTEQALKALLDYCEQQKIDTIDASTAIMIFPGYQFKVVNRLLTNFHQPQSTLLLLVAAFVGEKNWKTIYSYALDNNFRFLSYGDSSLLIR